MTLKTLVTGVAAAALVGAAAAGVTSVASSATSVTAVQPVVFGIPLPQAPGVPATDADLYATLDGLASGSFGPWIQGGLGKVESLTAQRLWSNAAAQGYLPLNFTVNNLNSDGETANADVTASGPKLGPTTQNLTFINAGNRWVLSKASAMALMAAVG